MPMQWQVTPEWENGRKDMRTPYLGPVTLVRGDPSRAGRMPELPSSSSYASRRRGKGGVCNMAASTSPHFPWKAQMRTRSPVLVALIYNQYEILIFKISTCILIFSAETNSNAVYSTRARDWSIICANILVVHFGSHPIHTFSKIQFNMLYMMLTPSLL